MWGTDLCYDLGQFDTICFPLEFMRARFYLFWISNFHFYKGNSYDKILIFKQNLSPTLDHTPLECPKIILLMVTIVLIEDYTDILEGTAELLELEGYQVIMAKNGKEGLLIIKQTPPDLIICDVRMPEMDGLALLACLGLHADLKRIPFIFYSAKSEKKDIQKGLDAGANDYVVKPSELTDLLESIKKCLPVRKLS